MIISGIVNYLFFASFTTLITLGAYYPEITISNQSPISSVFIYSIIGVLVVGIINMICLCFQYKDEYEDILASEKRLTPITYAIKLGNLMGIMAIFNVVIIIVLFYSDFSYSDLNPTYIGLYCLGYLFFYIKYSIYRLKDAKVSIVWLFGIIAVYLAMFGLKMWLNINVWNSLTLFYNTLFNIVASCFVAMQYVLFLLPTKQSIKGY
ncbi:hypothetical protein [Dysgonomonas sp. 216]|uniref:hypothetical protein n=1 Tax=Dysgonomonas sp. 216 TaxID=2302934 RepID=UPI001C88A09E|nr:hypothetical protein [Dysgonomonas sp. 216]